MKTLLVAMVFFPMYSIAQDEVETLTMKPYLVEPDPVTHALTITGESHLRQNRALGETEFDTIFCKVEILDTTSGVRMGSKATGLSGYISFWIESKALPIFSDTTNLGPYWDLYTAERPMRLIRTIPGVRIVRVIELGGVIRAGRVVNLVQSDEGKSEIIVEHSPVEIEVWEEPKKQKK